MENEALIITGSQHDRTWELDFSFIPKTDEEFLEFVKDCPTEMLKGFGFGLWGTYNEQVEENAVKPISNKISIPAINMDGSDACDFEFDTGRGDAPIMPLKEDREIWLLPAEWYNSIPEGYELFSLSGSSHLFKKGETDDDRRFGCLAYGILRKIITPKSK